MRILLILSLVLMAYDDFKTRSVSLVELCFFGICILFYSIRASGWTHMLNNAVCNIAAGVLMLVGTHIYYIIRKGCYTSLLNTKIGVGDLIYLAISSMLFPLSVYCWFIIISCLSGIGYSIMCRNHSIPFIGVSSPVLITILLIEWI